MSLYGVLRTGVSGLTAQASKLGTVGDNIANANTTGYKRSSTEFSSLVIGGGTKEHNPAGVTSTVRNAITQQGHLLPTTSSTDLAVEGNGFFVVSNGAGTPFLTRAGSFVPDGAGKLVNAGGFTLMGLPLAEGGAGTVANGFSGLQEVNITAAQLQASASTEGRLFVNLPSNADDVAAGRLPSDNLAASEATAKTSLLAFDNLGNEVLLDIYFAKSDVGEWDVAIFDREEATNDGFPYGPPGSQPLASEALNFDANGNLVAGSPSTVSFTVPNGAALELDFSQMTQLAADFTIMAADVNGTAPSAVASVEITDDGTLVALLENGARRPFFTIPLADVPSPDNLRPLTGNVYAPTDNSGDVRTGIAGTGGFGNIISNTLEESNVDMASELVSMIEAQRGYSANSKVFQTGAELLDVLINLKR